MFENKWYALQTKPRKERVLHQQVISRKIECFFPRVKVNPINPRAAKVHPYFPGYMFVRADLEEQGYSKFQWLPNSLGLVLFGGEPALVPNNLIVEIKKKVEQIAAAGGVVLDGLKKGDKVRIQSGPFKGYDAVFNEQLSGSERVKILLAFLNDRQILVELKAGQIKKI